MATAKKIVMAAAGVSTGTTPTLTQAINAGVLPGGTSQSSYTLWLTSFTSPALPAGYVAGERHFFIMTGTRDSQGAIDNNRYTDTLKSFQLVNNANSIDITTTRANMSVEVDGHSDFNSAIIGHIIADAVGSTTITVRLETAIQGGSDYMGILIVDGVTSIVSSTISSNNVDSATSSVNVNTGTTGTLGTAQLRMVAAASSNSGDANPSYTKNASEPTYTTLGQGENGTSERFGMFYSFTNTTPITQAITGSVSTSTQSANGLGHAAALINLN